MIFFLAVWVIAGPYGLWKYHNMKKKRETTYLTNIEQAKINKALEERIRRMREDPAYQEQVVRRELGWVRDGELLYQFINER